MVLMKNGFSDKNSSWVRAGAYKLFAFNDKGGSVLLLLFLRLS